MNLPEIDQIWDYRDPAGSERRFRECLSQAQRSGSEEYIVELLTQLARALCLQRRYDEAHAVLDEAESQLAGAGNRARIRCLLERGRVLNDSRRPDDALRRFQAAWELAEQTEERELAADALHMLAYVAEGHEGLQWHQVAIDYCENCSGERFRRWLCTLHMNAADQHEARQDYAAAMQSVEKSLAVAEELDWQERILLAKCFLARLSRLRGNVDQALAILKEVLQAKAPSGYAFEEHAECLLLLGQKDQSRAQFHRAYELLSQDPWFPPTESERLDRIRTLAGIMPLSSPREVRSDCNP